MPPSDCVILHTIFNSLICNPVYMTPVYVQVDRPWYRRHIYLYLTGLFHNRPNTVTKILSSSFYHPLSYGCLRHTDLRLFHSIVEDKHILYMYSEATHCGSVCYLLLTSSWVLGTIFICSNGEIRTISVSIVNFYFSDTDVTGNCLHVKWLKIYNRVSLRLNIQNINCLVFIFKINYRHIYAIELTDRAC
jgi:hypothetical protein